MHYSFLASILLVSAQGLAAPNVVLGPCASVASLTAEDFGFQGSYKRRYDGRKTWVNQSIAFRLANPVLSFKPRCSAEHNPTSDFIHRCTDSLPGHSASFTFDPDSNILQINQTWGCPGKGYQVEARTSRRLSLTCVNKDIEHDFFGWKLKPEEYTSGAIECERSTFDIPTV